jgi:Zn ribbon nucleic-acid-binding protein
MEVNWAQDGEIAGFRASATPDGAGALTLQATLWLLARHDLINAHDTGMTYFDDVADMVRDLRGRYPRAPRPPRSVLDRSCPVCDQYAFGATWIGDGVDQSELRCLKCEHTEDAASFIDAAVNASYTTNYARSMRSPSRNGGRSIRRYSYSGSPRRP